MGLSKNQLKLITSLKQKKYRKANNLFIAEGTKVVSEFLDSQFELDTLFCIDDTNYTHITNKTIISDKELSKISALKSPNNVLALFKIPKEKPLINNGLIVALDEINDPGNLGTIIRLCDWFGVAQIICSLDTVDCYNTKVVQATMGSLTRVSIIYCDLISFLKNTTLPIFGTTMNGKNVYELHLPKNAILVLGNEANGIKNSILEIISENVSIPKINSNSKIESLNVATATAILLNEFNRSF
jgi:TrmH family RNA methyltransferase